jgi:ABC-type multidrug transport system fused ATPase/permease subunit
VAKEVSDALFGTEGLLRKCAVIVATADPWWVSRLQSTGAAAPGTPGVQVAFLRTGYVAYQGSPNQIQSSGVEELEGLFASAPGEDQSESGDQGGQDFQIPQAPAAPIVQSNPQGDDDENDEPPPQVIGAVEKPIPRVDTETQTPLTETQKEALHVVKEEQREEGQVAWSTYKAYGTAVGLGNLLTCASFLVGIMVFQNFCNLWITYWTAEDKTDSFVYQSLMTVGVTPPESSTAILWIFGCLVLCFTICNFGGHSMEIIGGITAAQKLFAQAVEGAFGRPFRWWDANPTGRVLNRFSEDVDIMDRAITNVMGVIFGAVLYFFGHTVILAISNASCLLLLPFIAAGLEYYAKFYRMTIREVFRIYRVRMGLLYQHMLEAINGRVTVRSFARENQVMEDALYNLECYQQSQFCKLSLAIWLGFRMALIGYILTFWVKLRPILQYYGVVGEQSAALVGFSMTYSTETVGIIQQFINNYSELEMQLIAIERLSAYDPEADAMQAVGDTQGMDTRGLQLRDVTVTYRVGLLPALVGVSIGFAPGEVAAIVGRTGAGKTSLLLSVLQLVPYEGRILVEGQALEDVDSEVVRRRIVGVVPQQPVLFEGTLRWNMDPENLWNDEKIWEALSAVGLEAKCRGSSGLSVEVAGSSIEAQASDKSNETVEFSAGQQQMLCAARVLLRKPKVAMLDEVSSSLPAEAASSMVSTLVNRFKELDTTVLMVTHQENLLACCERVVRIAGGRVVGDSRS